MMSLRRLAEAVAANAAEVWAALEQENTTDALVHEHEDIVMDKINELHDREPDKSDDEENGNGGDTERTQVFHSPPKYAQLLLHLDQLEKFTASSCNSEAALLLRQTRMTFNKAHADKLAWQPDMRSLA